MLLDSGLLFRHPVGPSPKSDTSLHWMGPNNDDNVVLRIKPTFTYMHNFSYSVAEEGLNCLKNRC